MFTTIRLTFFCRFGKTSLTILLIYFIWNNFWHFQNKTPLVAFKKSIIYRTDQSPYYSVEWTNNYPVIYFSICVLKIEFAKKLICQKKLVHNAIWCKISTEKIRGCLIFLNVRSKKPKKSFHPESHDVPTLFL